MSARFGGGQVPSKLLPKQIGAWLDSAWHLLAGVWASLHCCFGETAGSIAILLALFRLQMHQQTHSSPAEDRLSLHITVDTLLAELYKPQAWAARALATHITLSQFRQQPETRSSWSSVVPRRVTRRGQSGHQHHPGNCMAQKPQTPSSAPTFSPAPLTAPVLLAKAALSKQ